MRRWSAPATTATRVVAALAVALTAPAAAAAGDPVGRLLAAVAAYGPAAGGVERTSLGRACGADRLCAARRLVAASGGRLLLQRVAHPDTDTIRWAKTRASLGAARRLSDGRALLVLDRFGRTAESELRAALESLAGADGRLDLVLDLRANAGGDFGRMLRVAGALIGEQEAALTLHGGQGRNALDLPASGPGPRGGRVVVLVGPRTASSGEILAALLRRYGGAAILGERTAGKDILTRIVPVDHDWRLLVPAERVEVPGETLTAGLRPDRPLPAALAALVGR